MQKRNLYAMSPRAMPSSSWSVVVGTLTEFAANPRWMGVTAGTPAFGLVLHTWTQYLRLHLHVHAVMACGVLGQDDQEGPRWHTPTRKPDFLFPVQALPRCFEANSSQR